MSFWPAVRDRRAGGRAVFLMGRQPILACLIALAACQGTATVAPTPGVITLRNVYSREEGAARAQAECRDLWSRNAEPIPVAGSPTGDVSSERINHGQRYTIISVGKPMPTIAAAYAGADRLAHVVLRYPEGVVEKIVDLAPVLASRYVYAALIKDDALFATLRISEDGNALEFANGLEISALWIERLPDQ